MEKKSENTLTKELWMLLESNKWSSFDKTKRQYKVELNIFECFLKGVEPSSQKVIVEVAQTSDYEFYQYIIQKCKNELLLESLKNSRKTHPSNPVAQTLMELSKQHPISEENITAILKKERELLEAAKQKLGANNLSNLTNIDKRLQQLTTYQNFQKKEIKKSPSKKRSLDNTAITFEGIKSLAISFEEIMKFKNILNCTIELIQNSSELNNEQQYKVNFLVACALNQKLFPFDYKSYDFSALLDFNIFDELKRDNLNLLQNHIKNLPVDFSNSTYQDVWTTFRLCVYLKRELKDYNNFSKLTLSYEKIKDSDKSLASSILLKSFGTTKKNKIEKVTSLKLKEKTQSLPELPLLR